jgi:hypothetical protein
MGIPFEKEDIIDELSKGERSHDCRVSGLLELIRIEATLAVASILGSRKPGIPVRGSSRVLRHERAGSRHLTPG